MSLPLRRVEKKVRSEEAVAPAGPRAKSTVRIPDRVPRQVIPKDGIAPEILALAESLGTPAEIFTWLHDIIDVDPKWGVHRTPLGTLQEGKGTVWDQAWLLQQLLSAVSVDAPRRSPELSHFCSAKLSHLTFFVLLGSQPLWRRGCQRSAAAAQAQPWFLSNQSSGRALGARQNAGKGGSVLPSKGGSILASVEVDARFQWGEIEIPTAILLNIIDVEDPWQAGILLTTAGVPIVLVVQGSQVFSARMSHVWLTAYVDYIPNRGVTSGPEDTWVWMDPTLKRFAIAEGFRLDDQVPFDLGEYLQSGTPFSPRQVYEEALQAYITDNHLGITLEEVRPSKTVIQDVFPFVPATLRGRILKFEGESPEVPAGVRWWKHLWCHRKKAAGKGVEEMMFPAHQPEHRYHCELFSKDEGA